MLDCSLHLLDVPLLRTFITSLQGGTIPDVKEAVVRSSRRDILINWSRKLIRAAAPLAEQVPPEQWVLFTQLRPFFITVSDAEQAALVTERFFTVSTLDDVLNLFREEVARIDPDQADEIVDIAKQDRNPGLLPLQSIEALSASFRAYLIYERRQLEELTNVAPTLSPAQLATAGRALTWRTCRLLAHIHPGWHVQSASLTALSRRKDSGFMPLVADPRGMYTEIAQRRIPGLYAYLPYALREEQPMQTGMCVPPISVPVALALFSTPNAVEKDISPAAWQAVQEALYFAQQHNGGIWEASGMLIPEKDQYPFIIEQQGEREDYPERFPVSEPVAVSEENVDTEEAAAPTAAQPAPENPPADFSTLWERTKPVGEETPRPTGNGEKTSWLKRMLKR